MGKYQRFEDVPVWQEGARLYQRILDVIEEPNVPLSATFRNQLERAGLNVCSGSAQALEWMSNDQLQALLRATKDSAIEIQSMVAVVSERPKLSRLRDPLHEIRTMAESCGRQLSGWRAAMDNSGSNRRTSSDGPAQRQSNRPTSTATPTQSG